jgi:peptidoglycan/LPS O-acetylase OafA/YrhL
MTPGSDATTQQRSSPDRPREAREAPIGLAYRPDIDGLRAVAILAVIVFHAFPTALGGGFAGVDIFFVISGYLITGIILARSAAGTFSAAGFYAGRIRRLFPALLVVIIALMAAGSAYLLADEFARLGWNILWSAWFSENISLWHESGYFDLHADHKPLLHLWSLAIEEQFYILYPLTLWIIARCSFRPLIALIVLGTLSFVANLLVVDAHREAAFYCLGTRAWELFAGGALACSHGVLPPGRMPRSSMGLIWRNVLSWSGLGLIAFSITCLNGGLGYPGWWGTIPVVGTVLVIAAGPTAFANAHLLSNRGAVAIGLISYPLYLWHWPLLSLWAIVERDGDSPWAGASILALSVILAAATYHLVERPLRRPGTRMKTAALTGMMVCLSIVGLLIGTGVIPGRFAQSSFDQLVHRAIGDWRYPGKFTPTRIAAVDCLIAGGSGAKTLFWGDSHVEQYGPRLYELVKDHHGGQRGVIFLSKGGTPPLPGVEKDGDPGWCEGNERRFATLAEDPQVDAIVIAAFWRSYLRQGTDFSMRSGTRLISLDDAGGRRLAADALTALVARLRDMGKRIYLVQDNPEGRELEPAYIFQRGFLTGGFTIHAEGVSKRALLARTATARELIDSVARRTGVSIIDPLPLLEQDGRFPSLSAQGEPIYKDSHHFRASWSQTMLRYLDITVEDPVR